MASHIGEFQGFAPSGREVELPFVAFYRFDGAGKLVAERVVMNLGPLGAAPAWQPVRSLIAPYAPPAGASPRRAGRSISSGERRRAVRCVTPASCGQCSAG